MASPPQVRLAEIHREGDAREVLSSFPKEVRAAFGFALWQLQSGQNPGPGSRRMQAIGPGVWELREQDERAWYRVIYLSRIGNAIYVLHCFEKQGRKTDRRDLNVARERLAYLRKRITEAREGE